MSYLDQRLHRERRRRREAPPVATGAGAWGEIVDHDSGDVTIDLFDDAARAWGPIPFLLASGTGPPVSGDRAFLHLDTDGEPAYAVVWR